jgi:hypothetical protein
MRRCGGTLGHVFPGDSVAGTPCECGLYERNESVRGFRDRRPPEILRRVVDTVVAVGIAVLCAWSLVVLVAACHPAPAKRVDLRTVDHEVFFCVKGSTEDEGLLACADSVETCVRARDLALKWGGHAGIKQVGECREVSVVSGWSP